MTAVSFFLERDLLTSENGSGDLGEEVAVVMGPGVLLV